MLELLGLTLFYAMLIASIVVYIFYFYEWGRHYTAPADKPVARPPFAPLITLVLAAILVFVVGIDPPDLPGDDGFLSRPGAVLVLSWLGWFLWRRT